MITRDVILTCFACSNQAPCQEWSKEFFDDEPVVISVPGSGGTDFRNKIIQWCKTGDCFAAAVKELKPNLNISIRRRGLVTFSVGWSAADELLKFEAERNRLDAYLLLDGCHTKDLGNWKLLGARAANLEMVMVMAHSSIKPTFISAYESNQAIFDFAVKANDDSSFPRTQTEMPDYIAAPKLEAPIQISLGASGDMPPIKKTWIEDPLFTYQNRGNLTRLHYKGNDRPDHVYIAWYVSKRLWKYLGECWAGNVQSTDLGNI